MTERINIGRNGFILPEPQTILGTMIAGRPNFMALAWVTRVNYSPCIMAIAVNAGHASNAAIRDTGQFSLNIPGTDMVEVTDYVGLTSGKRTDKSTLFNVQRGVLQSAPLIDECPISMEFDVIQTVDLPTNTLFLGELAATWTREEFMTDGYVDVEKVRPFTLTMPDNRYWAVGVQVGRAWHDGKALRDTLRQDRNDG
jgi:flavin reductase (DIM6/NTAB) family NADH-FMN oxidoreductase RutF